MRTFAELGPGNVVIRVVVADTIEWCIDNLRGRWAEQQEQGMAVTKAIQLPAPVLVNTRPTTTLLAIDEMVVRPRQRFLMVSYVAVDERGDLVKDGERVQETAEGDAFDAFVADQTAPTLELGRQLLIAKGRIDRAAAVVDITRK